MSNRLKDAIANMQEEEALALTKEMLTGGTSPLVILEACRAAMEIVGTRFETCEYFVPDLILAGEIMKQISAEVKPRLQQGGQTKKKGKVVLGTVQGDIHDIGKDIVVFMLEVNDFEVIDLGVDVPPQTFVEKIAEVKPEVVGLSGFLTVAYSSMKETVEAITAAGLRGGVKIMVGGGTVDDQIRVFSGADAFGKDAITAVTLAKQWTGGQR